MNERLADLGIKAATYLLDKLNGWTLEDIRRAIVRYETGNTFDQGIAQFLRLYLAARTIGAVTKQK
jgi:pterin-4a-carbinolamine dehydratase